MKLGALKQATRPARWKARKYRDHLLLADGKNLPFSDGCFDFVFAEGVIEHVGVIGDSGKVQADYIYQRELFLRSMKRVTKPGGYILVTTPNRLFPLDICHGAPHFHRISHPFYVSFGDIVTLFGKGVHGARQLTVRKFFNLRGRVVHFGMLRIPGRAIEAGLRLMNVPFFWRITSPVLTVLLQRDS